MADRRKRLGAAEQWEDSPCVLGRLASHIDDHWPGYWNLRLSATVPAGQRPDLPRNNLELSLSPWLPQLCLGYMKMAYLTTEAPLALNHLEIGRGRTHNYE